MDFLEHVLDFEILESADSKSLMFLDKSSYFKKPEMPLIEIKFPNSDKIYSTVISTGFSNITMENLCGSKDTPLPDGIYDITYSIAPNNELYITKKYFKLSFLIERLEKIIKNNNISDELIKKLYKIDVYLQAIKIIINSDEPRAISYYKEIDYELKQIEKWLVEVV